MTSQPENPALVPEPLARVTVKRWQVMALLFLLSGYFCLNLLGRWMRFALFHGHEPFGWKQPTIFESVYHVYMACLPVACWAVLVGLLAHRRPRLFNRTVLAILAFVVLIVVELDMSWYRMSRQHANWEDLELFMTHSWEKHLGLQRSDGVHFVKLAGMHAGVCVFAWLLCYPLGLYLARCRARHFFRVLRQKKIALVMVALLVADGLIVGYQSDLDEEADGISQWKELAHGNPFRINPVDEIWKTFSARAADLRAANASLADQPDHDYDNVANRPPGPPLLKHRKKDYHVVMITIEGLNAWLVHETEMLCWRSLAKRATQLTDHYSTGNCTHYGVLGMLFGSPVTFYKGYDDAAKGSPFIDLFTRRGYQSRIISCALRTHRGLGKYIRNFTEPIYERNNDWALIPELRKELAKKGPRLVYLFYYGTHFRYNHSEKFQKYAPEVAQDFDYSRWDLQSYRDVIINRYKNCLLELDAWLAAVLKEIDLEHTIVIVTGDHGEEFFKHGRLGHSSSLNDEQVRTPCLLWVPGMPGKEIQSVTSHADIMPSIVDVLGWETTLRCYGQSVFRESKTPSAVTAKNRHNRTAEVWAVVTEHNKAIIKAQAGSPVKILDLLDRLDHRQSFRSNPGHWEGNFRQIKRFQAWFGSH